MLDVFKEWKFDFLRSALAKLYAHDPHLVTGGLERAASARIACHLAREIEDASFARHFPEIRVDVDYEREGENPKLDMAGKHVVPDIIVHRPGPDGPNVAVIEIKGWWNTGSREKDADKLRSYLQQQHYGYAYFVELHKEGPEIIQIESK